MPPKKMPKLETKDQADKTETVRSKSPRPFSDDTLEALQCSVASASGDSSGPSDWRAMQVRILT